MPRTDLRASDEDRDRTGSALREACATGRLTLDELDERLGAAYAARTLGELATLLEDLPASLTAPARPTGTPARPKRKRLRGGRIAFSEHVALSAPPEVCRSQALEYIAPLLARWDYRLVHRGSDHLGFEIEYRPTWTVLVAVFGFPFGLFALLIKERERIDIEFGPGRDGGTRLVAVGKAPKAIRRAFAELQD